MNEKTLKEKLIEIQKELKAPKGQYNDFGKYKYRSAEDILEAVKPLLIERRLLMTIRDEILELGNGQRFYVKATVKVEEVNSGDFLEVTAYAREPDIKKGMDESQITGTASSYARKYALNGMFAIDDSKDPDTNEYQRQTQSKANTKTNTKPRKNEPKQSNTKESMYRKLSQLSNKLELTNDDKYAIADRLGIKDLSNMTNSEIEIYINELEDMDRVAAKLM